MIEDPKDDGGRHRLWVAHTVKDRQWGYSTRLGAVFDLGRLVNYVADFVDYNVSGGRAGHVQRIAAAAAAPMQQGMAAADGLLIVRKPPEAGLVLSACGS